MALWSPLLARIDDRLIHGQVVVGCCEQLNARRILLVDDVVADDSLQQKLYRLAVPPQVGVDFVHVDGAPARLSVLATEGELDGLVVVVARASIMERLLAAGARFVRVQLGGAHAREGASELVNGVFLDSIDRAALVDLIEAGTEVIIQPLPRSRTIEVDLALLEGGTH
ncbi:hypothetical protein DRQ53_00190 [bacterium]|nr:MAG: hypothetical protein DRQ53_00190 [bacterium]